LIIGTGAPHRRAIDNLAVEDCGLHGYLEIAAPTKSTLTPDTHRRTIDSIGSRRIRMLPIVSRQEREVGCRPS
jgi:hypothetical protein